MTRETKIGLLIGLGFIVVFAVLLSHTGPSAPTGDGLAMAPRNMPGKVSPSSSTPTNPTYVSVDQVRPVGRPVSDLISPPTRPSGRIGLSEPQSLPRGPRDTDAASDKMANLPLPRPNFKKNQTDGTATVVADHNKQMTPWEKILAGSKSSEGEIKLASANPAPSNLCTERVAPSRKEVTMVMQPPKVDPPQQTPRPVTPAATPTPEVKPDAVADAKKAPPARQEAAKEYVVQKGDNLRKIAKDYYGVASTKTVEFLVASNKSKIKDKDTIIEGQKLTIPPLPPEMFESASPNIDVSGTGEAVRTVTNEELGQALAHASGKQRTAPLTVKKDLSAQPTTAPSDGSLSVLKKRDRGAITDKSDKPEKLASAADKPDNSDRIGHRMYEVKAGDTPRSISARELGSANHWNEIIKLNPTLDPKKMKPGTKIKVPEKKPLVASGATKQVSA